MHTSLITKAKHLPLNIWNSSYTEAYKFCNQQEDDKVIKNRLAKLI